MNYNKKNNNPALYQTLSNVSYEWQLQQNTQMLFFSYRLQPVPNYFILVQNFNVNTCIHQSHAGMSADLSIQ